ncbi:MAG: Lpg1974 family pore-forming outer membrane protein [Chlamydiota bacterium]
MLRPLALSLVFSFSPLFAEENEWLVESYWGEAPVEVSANADWKGDPVCSGRKAIFSVDFLYFKAVEDSLVYARRVPQNPTYQPVIRSIEQSFGWDRGVRAQLIVPLPPENLELGASWICFLAKPPAVRTDNSEYGIYAGLAIPVFGSAGNSLVQEVRGKWSVNLNSVDCFLRSCVGAAGSFRVLPMIAVQSSWIHQRVTAEYTNYQIDAPMDNTPQKVTGKSEFWGIGPKIGLELQFWLPRNFGVFAGANFSTLFGFFSLKTTYGDLLQAPPGSKITVCDFVQRVAPFAQIQVGLSKKWALKEASSLEIIVGWEEQIWLGQMRMDWFSTLVSPPDGSDLTLSGLFVRGQINF